VMSATLEDLERRVVALEKAQNENTTSLRWIAGTLGQVQSAVEGVRSDLNDHTQRLDRIENDIKGIRTDLPGIVAGAVGDALRRE